MLTRKTKQKEFVIENLKKRFDHPTALQIYNDAKDQKISIIADGGIDDDMRD